LVTSITRACITAKFEKKYIRTRESWLDFRNDAKHILDVTIIVILVGLTPGGVMVRVLARDIKGRGFDSRPFHFQIATLGMLFTHM